MPLNDGSSRNRTAGAPSAPNARQSLSSALPEDLPPGWVRVESRSKRGAFYYAHKATGRTQVEKPVELNSRQRAFALLTTAKTPAAGLASALDAAKLSTSASSTAKAPLQRVDSGTRARPTADASRSVPTVDAYKEGAKRKTEEQKLDPAEVKRRAEELAQKQAEEAAAQEAEEEAVRQKAMAKRAQQAAAVKAHDDTAQDAKDESRLEEEEKIEKIRRATMQKDTARRRGEKKKTWAEEDDSDDGDVAVTAEDVEKWREDEERREREEKEAKIRAIEAEKQRIIDEALEKERLIKEAEEAKIRAEEEAERKIVEEALEKARQIAEFEEAKRKQREEDECKRQEEKLENERKEAEHQAEIARIKTETEQKIQEDFLQRERMQARLREEAEEAKRQRELAEKIRAQEVALERTQREERITENRKQIQQQRQQQGVVIPPPPSMGNTAAYAAGSAEPEAKRQRAEEWNSAAARSTGTIIWYNGRRRTGLVLDDRQRTRIRIAAGGAPNGGMCPPVPGGLMHGTRVTYMLTAGGPGQEVVCYDVMPLEGQNGLSCGGDSQTGLRQVNEDRTVAVDLPEGLGHVVGIFDGHRGTACADFLSQNLSKAIVSKTQETFNQWLMAGRALVSLSTAEEVDVITSAIVAAFEACDQEFLATAANYNLGDGASALMALVSHGYETADPSRSTVLSALGGQAKLFASWCGTGRMVLLRGREAVRITSDHVCEKAEERARLEALGAMVLQDMRGTWKMGRPDRLDLARQCQQGYEDTAGPKAFLAASRGFGDMNLKRLPYRSVHGAVSHTPVLTATPEVNVVDLTPADWAIVLAGRGIFNVIADQEIADIVLEAHTTQGRGPVEAAKGVTAKAIERGAMDNLTCIVMRFGWTQPPPMKTLAELLADARR